MLIEGINTLVCDIVVVVASSGDADAGDARASRGRPMNPYRPAKHGHRSSGCRWGPVVCAAAAAAGVLLGCDAGAPAASAHPGGVAPVGAPGLLARTGTILRPAPPAPPAPDPAVAGGVDAQPEVGGLKIEFVGPRPPGFPFRMDFSPGPPETPASIELSPLKFDEAGRSRLQRLLHVEMAKYPSGVLGFVSQVYVGGTLTYNSDAVGGFHFLGMVFIAAGEHDAGASTDAHVARAFHHEVAHALMDAHRATFDGARFRAALPAGFNYDEERPADPPPALTAGSRPGDDSPSLDLLDEGFLVPWGKRSMDEDFASYAEVLVRKPELLLATFAPESRVGRKARVVRDFYIAIDPRFEAVFEPRGR